MRITRGRSAIILLGVLTAVWAVYKVGTVRPSSGRSTAETGCESDPSTIALLYAGTPSELTVHCSSWETGTGVTAYVWHAREARAALLFEHGWGDHAQRYVKYGSRLIPELLEHGISVYAIDMWGNGRSPGRRGATDLDSAVEDHRRARKRLGGQRLPVFVLGHSVGGLVTAASVLDDQENVRGMVLISPALDWQMSGGMRMLGRVGAFLLPTFSVPVPPGEPADQSRDAEFHKRSAADPLMHTAAISWATAGTGANLAYSSWRNYYRIKIPLLVVNGSADKVTPPDANRAFVAMVGSEDKTFQVIDGGRHALLDDPPSSTEALRAILDWLEQRLPPRSTSPQPHPKMKEDK